MRILIRAAAFGAVLAVYYGIAALLPAGRETPAGFVAFATVMIGVFLWARRDGRVVNYADALRDWLVIAAIVSVFWWVTLVLFEGADDVITRISDQFLSVVLTAGLVFAPAVLGVILGRGSRGD